MTKARLTKDERAAMADRFFTWLHRVLTAAPPPETEGYDTIVRVAEITSPLAWGNFVRFLAAAMVEYSTHGEDVMASIRTIASDSHIGESTAQRYLDAAVRLHMLEQTRPPGKRTFAAYAIADWDWDWDGDQPQAAHAETEPETATPAPQSGPDHWKDPQVTGTVSSLNGHEDGVLRWPLPQEAERPLLPDQIPPLPDEYPYQRLGVGSSRPAGRRTGRRRWRCWPAPSPGWAERDRRSYL
jgi:hypothetical protein